MAARVAEIADQKNDPMNSFAMHAMAPNLAGIIGLAVAACELPGFLGG